MIKQILLLITGLIPVVTYGSPNITSVSGATTNGSTITITGSGFGVKATAAPRISSFDSATSADNFASGTFGENWWFRYNGDDPTLTTSTPRTGYYQSSQKVTYDAAGEYSTIGYNLPERSDYVYVSWWTYWDYPELLSTVGSGDNCKYMRLHMSTEPGRAAEGIILSQEVYGNNDDGDPPNEYKHTYAQGEYAPECRGWSIAYSAIGASVSSNRHFRLTYSDNNVRQQWNHYEMYNYYSPNKGTQSDVLILLRNGQTVYRAVGVNITATDSRDDKRNIRLGQVSGDRTESQMEYIDQIYYDTSFSHVFISDTATLSFPDNATTNIQEVQVASAWNDGSITVTVNQGSIPNGQAYLYVMDADGDINTNGYAVTLGGEDNQSPTLTETTPIPTPTTNHTPNYTFSSTEAGTIIYTGDCSSSTTSAISGNNTITLNNLSNGTYSNCTITVTDSSNNISDLLSITSFTINRSIASNTKADVDANSNINRADAMLVLRNSLGLSMSGTNWKDSTTTGDVNCDGVSNSTDALLILRDSLDLDMSGTGWCVN